MIAIILVGGFGTRLRPLTLLRPKALMPVLNAPFLSYQIDLLEKAKVKEIIFAANPAFRKWERSLRRLARPGIKFLFAYEPSPMGTGGAVRFAYDAYRKKSAAPAGPYVVFNGDVLFDLDVTAFRRFHEKKRSEATIALTAVEDPSRFGLVRTEEGGRITAFVEKPQDASGPSNINAGAYMLSRSAIDSIPPFKSVSIERETFPSLLHSRAPMFGFALDGYWNDIGTHPTYLQAHFDLMNGALTGGRAAEMARRQKSRLLVGNGFKVLLGAGSSVKKSVKLQGVVCLGKKVRIMDGCQLKDSVILDETVVEENSHVDGWIIGDRSVIEHDAVVENAVLGPQSKMTPFSRC